MAERITERIYIDGVEVGSTSENNVVKVGKNCHGYFYGHFNGRISLDLDNPDAIGADLTLIDIDSGVDGGLMIDLVGGHATPDAWIALLEDVIVVLKGQETPS